MYEIYRYIQRKKYILEVYISKLREEISHRELLNEDLREARVPTVTATPTQ